MKTLLLGIAAILLVVAGCDDDSDCVNCVSDWRPLTPAPTLTNIWPNADGTSWTYDHALNEWDEGWTFYPTREAVPMVPLPDWSEVYALLNTEHPGGVWMSETGTYTMTFDGQKTTPPGVTAQNLLEDILIDSRSGAGLASSAVIKRVSDPLRATRSLLIRGEASATLGNGPIMIHGGAWKRTSSYLATYGDYDKEPAWKFLTSNLNVGSTFSLQLIPWLASGVYLHGHVYRQIAVDTEIGTLKKALDCLYIIDYGISVATDTQGRPVGYFRSIDCGRVIYAPTIGPVYCHEKRGIQPEDPNSHGIAEVIESLVGTSLVKR